MSADDLKRTVQDKDHVGDLARGAEGDITAHRCSDPLRVTSAGRGSLNVQLVRAIESQTSKGHGSGVLCPCRMRCQSNKSPCKNRHSEDALDLRESRLESHDVTTFLLAGPRFPTRCTTLAFARSSFFA
jgi:hypothetical protein